MSAKQLSVLLLSGLMSLEASATELNINGTQYPLAVGSGDIVVATQRDPIQIISGAYTPASVRSPVGVNGTFGAGSRRRQHPIYFFPLPDLAGGGVTSASFAVDFTHKADSPNFNLDVWGLGFTSVKMIDIEWRLFANLDGNPGVGIPTPIKIADNIVTPATALPTTATTSPTNNTTLVAFLNSLYQNGAQAGDFVIFRINPDQFLIPHVGGTPFYMSTVSIEANEPPTADAGANQLIHVGLNVLLDGAGSFDDITATADLIYSWSFSARPTGSSASLNNANTSNPSFVADVLGAFEIELVVEDEAGNLSSPDIVQVSSLNSAPEADAGEDQVIILTTTAFLDGNNSLDADGDLLIFSWQVKSKPANGNAFLIGPTTSSPSITPDLAGAYELELTVNDGFADSTPDSVSVTVISGEEFAEMQLMDANAIINSLSTLDFDAAGHQHSFTNLISQVINFIQQGNTSNAISRLSDLISRTDGCALRGAPDATGQGKDWISDCSAQNTLYPVLVAAQEALALL